MITVWGTLVSSQVMKSSCKYVYVVTYEYEGIRNLYAVKSTLQAAKDLCAKRNELSRTSPLNGHYLYSTMVVEED